MKKTSILFTAILFFNSVDFAIASDTKPLKVLFTAAIISRDFEIRKESYIRNLQLLKEYGCDIYVVESCQSGPTFLDEFCDHVCYTQSNDPSKLTSYNEVTSMQIGLKYFNFDPDETIIKVTGRYVLEDNQFILLVKNHLDCDVIARKWDNIPLADGKVQHDAYTGCFAIKVKHLHSLIDDYYWKRAVGSQLYLYGIEWALGDYLADNENSKKILYISKLYDYLPECLSRK